MTRSSIFFTATAVALTLCLSSYAAAPDHKELSDTLGVIMGSRTGLARNKLKLKKILVRSGKSDFYFDSNLGGYKWDEASISGFKDILHDLTGRKVGTVFAGRNTLDELITPTVSNDGAARKYRFSSRKDPRGVNFVSRLDAPFFKKGLSGRHISLWNSHGRYYDNDNNVWTWQRPTFFGTVEDLFSYCFAFEYLAPMLENAGAYVLSPRERDTNRDEYVCDNDPAFTGGRDEGMRKEGTYREEGQWHPDGPGFSDSKPRYAIDDNPFATGTARYANCVGAKEPTASAEWSADIRKRGEYAVYVSYKSNARSSSCAHYTVRHLGGTAEFAVDQRKCGSTWVYLGTFEFEGRAVVTLDNSTPEGYRSSRNMLVSADAVRIGGGMGKVERGPSPDELSTSGLPAFAEGAIYPSVWGATLSPVAMKWEREYVQDYVLRGAWTTLMKEEKGIPVDLSLAFHTDAGIMGADSTVGTLAI
ncbi:MAG: hypothetical protein MJY44_03275 [Bacteroidales bacterium]|nr:hypothetical protein [Bacteroidales bacterium]